MTAASDSVKMSVKWSGEKERGRDGGREGERELVDTYHSEPRLDGLI